MMSETRDPVSVDIESMLLTGPPSSPNIPTIFRVDHDTRHGSENLYDPKVVSIGPFHHQTTHLQKMQPHKLAYLKGLLKRRGESVVDECVAAVRSLEEKARGSYSETIEVSPDELVKIIVLDGLFVVELLRKNKMDDLRKQNDPIFRYDQVFLMVQRDLMLVENQVPFFVLDRLFAMTRGQEPEDNIFYLVNLFTKNIPLWPNASEFLGTQVEDNVDDHLLGLVYKNLLSSFKKRKADSDGPIDDISLAVNSVSELKETWVEFKKSNCLDITFAGGVLRIPKLRVEDETESFLRNLIAYEQFFADGRPKYVTDYTFFLHCLVKRPRDVEILRRRGILDNYLGGDEMVCRVFGSLGRNVVVSSWDFRYAGVSKEVNGYCGRRRNRWMAVLRRDYFNSPWSFIKFCAASLLLLFTLIQTLFAVLGDGKFKSSI
ncbi:Plant protein of unknown function (DUF247 [Striga hermonthica]|uniref:Uncharacterized protein n=1 Tax=Striga hermonthica TaxID=68872 RepID=A0A9N7MP22_STRHE|nr:Plant protein of unknown function (DUF247 [Striga hermonthica]